MEQDKIDELGFCPSFNCYSSDSVASTAAIKISNQLQQEQIDDFEFSLDEFASKNIDSENQKVFPLFNRDLLNEEIDCTNSLGKLFINEREENESESSFSSDDNESEAEPVFCVWRPKTDSSSSPLSKCKKSSSTGSGSKRWRIRDLLRRSNSEGKEPMVLLTNKKVQINEKKRRSGEVAVVSGKLKPSVHELFYVQQRAKREDGKRKSYLPYRQGLVGLFSNVNGKGNGFPF